MKSLRSGFLRVSDRDGIRFVRQTVIQSITALDIDSSEGPGDHLMVAILEQIFRKCDALIIERLTRTDIYSSKARKGLGRHIRKDDTVGRFCRGRKVRKMGYRKEPIKIGTVFGYATLRIREVECCKCGARYSPLLGALKIALYDYEEMDPENGVIESVIDTSCRELIDWRSIDVSLCGIASAEEMNYDTNSEVPAKE